LLVPALDWISIPSRTPTPSVPRGEIGFTGVFKSLLIIQPAQTHVHCANRCPEMPGIPAEESPNAFAMLDLSARRSTFRP